MEKAGVFQPIELKLYLDKCECSSVKVKFIPNQINNLVNFCPARYNCIRVDSIVNILFASVQVVLYSYHLRRGEDYEDFFWLKGIFKLRANQAKTSSIRYIKS